MTLYYIIVVYSRCNISSAMSASAGSNSLLGVHSTRKNSSASSVISSKYLIYSIGYVVAVLVEEVRRLFCCFDV